MLRVRTRHCRVPTINRAVITSLHAQCEPHTVDSTAR